MGDPTIAPKGGAGRRAALTALFAVLTLLAGSLAYGHDQDPSSWGYEFWLDDLEVHQAWDIAGLTSTSGFPTRPRVGLISHSDVADLPDLAGRINRSAALNCDNNPCRALTSGAPRSIYGTFAASEIGAISDNGIGIAGIMPDVEFTVIQIDDRTDVPRALDALVGMGLDVAVLWSSWIVSDPAPMCAAAARAHDAGTLVIAPQASSPTLAYPAGCPTVLSTGMVTSWDALMSNSAPWVDVLGRHGGGLSTTGEVVTSTIWFGALPVTALAAMLAGLHPEWGPNELRHRILSTAEQRWGGEVGPDPDGDPCVPACPWIPYYGHGVIDLPAAVSAASFSVIPEVQSIIVVPGHPQVVGLTIERSPGFTGPVDLDVDIVSQELPRTPGDGISWGLTGTGDHRTLTIEADHEVTGFVQVTGTGDGLARTSGIKVAPRTFALDLADTTVAMSPDRAREIDVSVRRVGGFSETVTPAIRSTAGGTSAQFVGSGDQWRLRLETPDNVADIPTTIVYGAAAGGVDREWTLEVGAGGYTMSIESGDGIGPPGGSTSYSIRVARWGGYDEHFSFAAGAPPGATVYSAPFDSRWIGGPTVFTTFRFSSSATSGGTAWLAANAPGAESVLPLPLHLLVKRTETQRFTTTPALVKSCDTTCSTIDSALFSNYFPVASNEFSVDLDVRGLSIEQPPFEVQFHDPSGVVLGTGTRCDGTTFAVPPGTVTMRVRVYGAQATTGSGSGCLVGGTPAAVGDVIATFSGLR